MTLALAGVAFGDPAHWIAWTIVFSLALGFAGATQDMAIDGWRITAAPPGKQSPMTAFSEAGYRVAIRYGWRVAYLCMAALMTIGALSAILAPEPHFDFVAHRDRRGYVATIIAPIKEFWAGSGRGAIAILLLIAGFRMPGQLVERHVRASVQEPAHFLHGHCDCDKALWLLDRAWRTSLGSYIVRKVGLVASLLVGTPWGLPRI